jgi:AcrR family transcriptional regulator
MSARVAVRGEGELSSSLSQERGAVPKISAPTVAEHRARQRESLIEAATELLVSEGVKAVTPAAVGAAAGLARPSVYQYFGSRSEILMAVVEDSFPASIAALDDVLCEASGPLDVMELYIRETLRQAAAGAHRVASALDAAQLPEDVQSRLAELHHAQMQPFLDALRELDVDDLFVTAQLLGGMVESAMRAVENGADVDAVTRRAISITRAAVA